jgi:hypothetical protein
MCFQPWSADHCDCDCSLKELLMMDITMPETCWAASMRLSNKFYDWLFASGWVFLFECPLLSSIFKLYVFFWVIPRRLNFICWRFGTLYLFHLHRQVGKYNSDTGELPRRKHTEHGESLKSRITFWHGYVLVLGFCVKSVSLTIFRTCYVITVETGEGILRPSLRSG